MKKLFEIESDCLDIVRRLKEIDPTYYVVRNLDTQKFELHSRGQKPFSYCLTIPFDTLDERTLDLTLKTRVQNSDKLFEELERENLKQKQKAVNEVLNNFKEKLYDT